MLVFRPSVAGRALRASAPAVRQPLIAVRYESKAASSVNVPIIGAGQNEKPAKQESIVNHKEAGAVQRRHNQPDYTAKVDTASSLFSPVPLRVMNGSEPGEITPAAVLSGAPLELQARTVRIYKPAKTATQSGDWHGHQWRMDWDILPKGHRWENPLMGWQSSGDRMQGTHLNFKSREDAIRFAEKQGNTLFRNRTNERLLPRHMPTTLCILSSR